MANTLSDDQLERYSRHILLPQIDVAGQQQLLNAHVLIIGLGGLGSPAAMYLAASGIGQLTLCDFDRVEMSNLQRQIAHQTIDIGKTKVESARETLSGLNPDIKINTIDKALSGNALIQQILLADIVIDASDNFDTRFAINQACVKTATALVSGSAIRFQGQVAVFSNQGNSPCYRCLYPESSLPGSESCSDSGILAPVVGIIGATMATEALKLIMNIGISLNGRLLLLNAETMHWRNLSLPRDPGCPVCANEDICVNSVL
jgi:adenylyltransferase/sulfurtransferase